MSFISYAQNYEDVMLWRALKHIKNGFYIDVGAAWPDKHSVTKAFYEKGWQGINIEPNPMQYISLVQQRPRDYNLQLAVGDHVGRFTMNFIDETGLSTAIDAIAEQHQAEGWTINRKEIELTTLQSVCRKYIKLEQPIHFLKVDVEGLEEEALRGNDWSAYRPWVVVVEATLPMTQTESYEGWESILLTADYTFAYADGLNRFYVANEHSDLLKAFKYPPNIFDGFILNSHQEAESEDRAQQAEAKAQQAEARAQQAEAKAHQAETKAQQAETKAQQAETKAQQAEVASNQRLMQLHAVYNSTSWRITTPLRWLGTPVMSQRSKDADRPKQSFTKLFIRWAMAQPKLVAFAHRLLHRFPALREVIARRVASALHLQTAAEKPQAAMAPVAADLGQLSPRARHIYADLKSAVAQRQKENG